MVVALAISNQWKIKSLDIKSAFLQGQDIKRDLYLMPPPEAATKNVWKQWGAPISHGHSCDQTNIVN